MILNARTASRRCASPIGVLVIEEIRFIEN
ncbi:hypothetical protein AGR7C_Lc60028 [Agrobacterium deltaense Zutra 3/1]|uniref:Uncharacterized protein n=1 Tax=Agrobacterium deltaense Zutra 3/1 TaxID=1183427 RepID=A0A1S7RWR3_9HYPH|nr:hypothetical protein AGR7C_Lc60028 [Agrobacterium deltaense Zutra 3/1]